MSYLLENSLMIVRQIQESGKMLDKKQILEANAEVQKFLATRPQWEAYLQNCDPSTALGFKGLIAIGQGEAVLGVEDLSYESSLELEELGTTLQMLESFYAEIGGVIGYHATVCKLLAEPGQAARQSEQRRFLPPPCYDLRGGGQALWQAVRWGLKALENTAEIYVVGGAAERLGWNTEKGTKGLPAALLPFCGRTLLEGLLRDLQAREYLYYKLNDMQLMTPVILMTSEEKNNHAQIVALCERADWYGRERTSWHFVSQPLVPLIDEKGQWCVDKPLKLHLRPGGHGVLWKLLETNRLFAKLKNQNCLRATIRQINNPLGDTDGAILALSGLGMHEEMSFGFLACERRAGTAEGVDVLIAHIAKEGVRYAVTNVEYTALAQAAEADRDLAHFPANTNLLYANLQAVEDAVKRCPFPGLLVNAKSSLEGTAAAGRLETMMQNIADFFLSSVLPPEQAVGRAQLPTCVVFRERLKTIASAKRGYREGASIDETPQGAHYATLCNYFDLFRNHCQMRVPAVGDEQAYLDNEWGFLAYLNPSLGPLFAIIAQKICGGEIAKGAELELEIAELDLQNLSLQGSLSIVADAVNGAVDSDEVLRYSHHTGKCCMHGVNVINAGIDFQAACTPWSKSYQRREALRIVVHGDGEFYASNITLRGNLLFEVPTGFRMTVTEKEGQLHAELRPLTSPSWWWNYSWSSQGEIALCKTSFA